MKVLIINSPLFREYNPLYDEDSLPPIGLGYIATHLQNNGMDVELVDAVDQRIPLDELIKKIRSIQPDVVATNIFTTNYELVKELIESLRFPVHVIVGGLSTKQLWEQILEWDTVNPIDIVTGDGELITLDLVTGVAKDTPFKVKDNKKVYRIDNGSAYLVHDISDVPLNRDFFLNEPVRHPLGFTEANIVTSRGCIYNCTFCAAARTLNKDYPIREKSVVSIISELSSIKEKYPQVNSIRVLDDLFLKKKESVEKAIEVFSQFNFQWRSMAHVMTFKDVDDEVMGRLKESGCFELFIGIESGSPAILRSISKTPNVDVILHNLSKVLRAGINMKGYFIYGFPDETEADMQMTLELAIRLKDLSLQYGVNFRTSVFQYRPYHGTQIYHDLQAKGANLEVKAVQPNPELSDLIGRLQFNFHSGNYSGVDNQVLHDYICRTTNLNGGKIFSGLSTNKELV